jgi:Carboxypeptidase regulatory-like domain
MANRSERLNRLAIGSSCESPWEDMEGEGRRRFCAECERHVHDFATMPPAEIEALLQAHHGRLCARLTRRHGRLVMAPEPALPPLSEPAPRRRFPALAAGLVTAWLAGSASLAQSQEPAAGGAAAGAAEPEGPEGDAAPAPARRPAASPRAALFGRVRSEHGPLAGATIVARNLLDGQESSSLTDAAGNYSIVSLTAGMYVVEGTRDSYSVAGRIVTLRAAEQRQEDLAAEAESESATTGILMVTATPLRRIYDGSDLVVIAEAGPSVVTSRRDDVLDVVTTLHVESSLKGAASGRNLVYRHTEYQPPDQPEWRPELVPGTRVLALLARSAEPDGRGDPTYEPSDHDGLHTLGSDAERAAYVSRLTAWERVRTREARTGETSPADIVEWLVATAENPYTRGEVTGELAGIVSSLFELGQAAGDPADRPGETVTKLVEEFHAEGGTLHGEPPDEVLGAAFTAGQRQRLTAALLATEREEPADNGLMKLVLTWDEKAARAWLAARFAESRPGSTQGLGDISWLLELPDELDDANLEAIAAGGRDRENAIIEQWPPANEETVEQNRREIATLAQDLRRQYAAALAQEPRRRHP